MAITETAQTDERETYNGWTNYETWAVKLWLDNDEATYNMCLGLAEDARQDPNPHPEIFTGRQHASHVLADHLKAQVEDESPLADTASLYSDLLNAAISEVDWSEIAGAYLDETEPPSGSR